MMETTLLARHAQPLVSRREFLGTAGAATLALAPLPALADSTIRLPLPGGPDELDHDGLSREGGANPAAHAPAVVGNAVRSVRWVGIHAQRSVLRALALGARPDPSRHHDLPADGARPCQSKPLADAR